MMPTNDYYKRKFDNLKQEFKYLKTCNTWAWKMLEVANRRLQKHGITTVGSPKEKP